MKIVACQQFFFSTSFFMLIKFFFIDHLYAHIPDLVTSDHLYHTVDHPQQQQQQQQHSVMGNMLEVKILNKCKARAKGYIF